ncbi:phosphoribosylaminoimidazolesuccinocarboxamide synthase [Flavobacterium sp. NRK1]|uniref:phosphoribosylaminoimidazolesuccinocarboxamide synthase n=1 Tax=Flavobacterium sp. NRK1 TaxID=2954929 RepID=UPI002092AC6F|nr:phosphoribosylaminoimidazolesuccinocarboxamide synthase [Flavobacterium sp. NRK1]MCO6146765.1 phosphoribosylaminoimidazolesuccinocarboxamide synthase [Flavobacterium sp. NRK1]
MENNTTFRTKTGYCHVMPDKILLSANSNPHTVFQVPTSGSVMKRLTMYGLLSLCLIYQGYISYRNNDNFFTVLFGGFGLFLLYVVITSINNSSAPVIERKDIEKVQFTKAIPWLRRSYFSIFFNENGKIKKRIIMMPGSLTGGAEETIKALEIMKREGLLKNNFK